MTVTPRDELMEMLAQLPGPAPRASRDALVRARCHAAITASRRRPHPVARAAQRAIDKLLPLAVVVYGVVTLWEALRMAGVL